MISHENFKEIKEYDEDTAEKTEFLQHPADSFKIIPHMTQGYSMSRVYRLYDQNIYFHFNLTNQSDSDAEVRLPLDTWREQLPDTRGEGRQEVARSHCPFARSKSPGTLCRAFQCQQQALNPEKKHGQKRLGQKPGMGYGAS